MDNKQLTVRGLRSRFRIAVFPLLALLAAISCVHADTAGYEFRPGPHVPKDFKPGPGVDASGMDLSGSAFIGMDLSRANFQGCNLQRSFFYQIRFQQGSASFREADLRYARFTETPGGPKHEGLDESDFTDALIQGLQFSTQYAHLTLDQLRSTKSFKLKDLSGCQIVGGKNEQRNYSYYDLQPRPVAIDFRQFDLRNATFAAGDFSKSDFTGAIITGATFFKSTITPAQIRSTSRYTPDPHLGGYPGSFYVNPDHYGMLDPRTAYSNLGFAYTDLSTWDFAKADLRGARFCEVNLSGVDFSGADIRGAHFCKSISREQFLATKSYQTGNLAGIILVRLDLSNIDFSGQNLAEAQFVECNLSGTQFADAVITNVNFRGCFLHPPALQQIKSTWNYKHGHMEGIRLPDTLAAALKAERAAAKEKTQDAQ